MNYIYNLRVSTQITDADFYHLTQLDETQPAPRLAIKE